MAYITPHTRNSPHSLPFFILPHLLSVMVKITIQDSTGQMSVSVFTKQAEFLLGLSPLLLKNLQVKVPYSKICSTP